MYDSIQRNINDNYMCPTRPPTKELITLECAPPETIQLYLKHSLVHVIIMMEIEVTISGDPPCIKLLQRAKCTDTSITYRKYVNKRSN